MIIWNRLGIVVVPAAFVPFFLVNTWLTHGLGHAYFVSHSWPKAIAALCSAAVVGVTGYLLNRREKTWSSMHRLYWLPVEYWSIVILVFAAFLVLAG